MRDSEGLEQLVSITYNYLDRELDVPSVTSAGLYCAPDEDLTESLRPGTAVEDGLTGLLPEVAVEAHTAGTGAPPAGAASLTTGAASLTGGAGMRLPRGTSGMFERGLCNI